MPTHLLATFLYKVSIQLHSSPLLTFLKIINILIIIIENNQHKCGAKAKLIKKIFYIYWQFLRTSKLWRLPCYYLCEQFPVWNDLYQDVLPEIQAIKEQNGEKLLKFLDEIANAGFDPETERQKVDELISTDNMLMELLSDEVKKHIKTIIRELDSQQSFNQRDLKTEIQPSQIDLDEGPTMEQ